MWTGLTESPGVTESSGVTGVTGEPGVVGVLVYPVWSVEPSTGYRVTGPGTVYRVTGPGTGYRCGKKKNGGCFYQMFSLYF